MTTQAFEQFDVMDTQALAAVEGGDDYDAVGAGAGALIGASIGYLLQTYTYTDTAPVVNFW
ncbi:bacteriocin class II family protein [Streptococcus dentasini]